MPPAAPTLFYPAFFARRPDFSGFLVPTQAAVGRNPRHAVGGWGRVTTRPRLLCAAER